MLNGTSDDGFDFSTVNLIPGRDATISFYVTNTTGQQAYLNGWIDFNGDGTWNTGSGSTEIVANSLKVQPGENTLTIHVPADAVVGNTFARFRLSLQPALSPKGADVVGGEVEDYQVSILPPPGQITGTVWNDRNGNGVHDAGEPGLAGWTVYLDANNNGVLDAGERTATTAADGSYTFTDVLRGHVYRPRGAPVRLERNRTIRQFLHRHNGRQRNDQRRGLFQPRRNASQGSVHRQGERRHRGSRSHQRRRGPFRGALQRAGHRR